jgi:hypothetical protein
LDLSPSTTPAQHRVQLATPVAQKLVKPITKSSAEPTPHGITAVKPKKFMEPNEFAPSIVVGLRPVETTPNGKRSVVPMYDGKNPAVPTLDGRESVATTSV